MLVTLTYILNSKLQMFLWRVANQHVRGFWIFWGNRLLRSLPGRVPFEKTMTYSLLRALTNQLPKWFWSRKYWLTIKLYVFWLMKSRIKLYPNWRQTCPLWSRSWVLPMSSWSSLWVPSNLPVCAWMFWNLFQISSNCPN